MTYGENCFHERHQWCKICHQLRLLWSNTQIAVFIRQVSGCSAWKLSRNYPVQSDLVGRNRTINGNQFGRHSQKSLKHAGSLSSVDARQTPSAQENVFARVRVSSAQHCAIVEDFALTEITFKVLLVDCAYSSNIDAGWMASMWKMVIYGQIWPNISSVAIKLVYCTETQ